MPARSPAAATSAGTMGAEEWMTSWFTDTAVVAPLIIRKALPHRRCGRAALRARFVDVVAALGAGVWATPADQAVDLLRSIANRAADAVTKYFCAKRSTRARRFRVGMRNGPDPAGDFPIAGERHQVGQVVIAV